MHGYMTRLFMKTGNLLKLAFRPLIFTFKITSFSKAIHLFSSPISSQLQSLLIILFYKLSIMLILLSILINRCCFHRVTSSPCYLRFAKLTRRFVLVLQSPCYVQIANLLSQYLQISFSLSVLSGGIAGFLPYQRISNRQEATGNQSFQCIFLF